MLLMSNMASTNARRPSGCSLQTPHQTRTTCSNRHRLHSASHPSPGWYEHVGFACLSGSCSIRHHSPGAKVWPSSDGKRPEQKRNQLLRPKAALCSVYVSSLPAPSFVLSTRLDAHVESKTGEQILVVIRIHREAE